MKHLAILGLFLILFLLFEFLKIYYIMPFPSSQSSEMVWFSFPLHRFRVVFRFIVGLGILYFAYRSFTVSLLGKVFSVVSVLVVCVVFYFVTYVAAADGMFKQLDKLNYVNGSTYDSNRIVMGVNRSGEAMAYPIEMVGYHHFIVDSVGGEPYLITYCTVCHSGRVFSPVLDGKLLKFRLVGMDLFNAILEDCYSGSWFRQATGECIAGPFKGKKLEEFSFVQCSVAEWLSQFPQSRFLKEDSRFDGDYRSIDGFAVGNKYGGLIGIDSSTSWSDKSWVIGINVQGISKAYLWNDVVKRGPFVDTVGHVVVEVYANDSTKDFFVRDYRTDSFLLSYQEFWHSWQTFHPGTLQNID